MTLEKVVKEGRTIVQYVLTENGKTAAVDKATMVKLVQSGQVANAKIQVYQGRPIVRYGSEVAVVTNTGASLRTAQPVQQRNTASGETSEASETDGQELYYSNKDVRENYPFCFPAGIKKITRSQIILCLLKEFNLKEKQVYYARACEKYNMEEELDVEADKAKIAAIQSDISFWLSNMALAEARKIYLKYKFQ